MIIIWLFLLVHLVLIDNYVKFDLFLNILKFDFRMIIIWLFLHVHIVLTDNDAKFNFFFLIF